MSREITVSIVTPTYNRGYLLHKCFDSLLAQTDRDFEWIIVDDGSSDDTETVVRGFEPADFPIIYIKKENGGKHTACIDVRQLHRAQRGSEDSGAVALSGCLQERDQLDRAGLCP